MRGASRKFPPPMRGPNSHPALREVEFECERGGGDVRKRDGICRARIPLYARSELASPALCEVWICRPRIPPYARSGLASAPPLCEVGICGARMHPYARCDLASPPHMRGVDLPTSHPRYARSELAYPPLCEVVICRRRIPPMRGPTCEFADLASPLCEVDLASARVQSG